MIHIYHVKSSSEYETPNLQICRLILQEHMLRVSESDDPKTVMTLSKGRINPRGGFIMVTRGEEVLRDYFELVAWIERNGLRLI